MSYSDYPQSGAYINKEIVYEGYNGHIIKDGDEYAIYINSAEIDRAVSLELAVALIRAYSSDLK